MGNCLSDPSTDKKAKPSSSSSGQRLGSTPTVKAEPGPKPKQSNIHTLNSPSSPPQLPPSSVSSKANYHGGRNTLGDGYEDPVRAEGQGGAREAALRAAEERAAKVSSTVPLRDPDGQLRWKLRRKHVSRSDLHMRTSSPWTYRLITVDGIRRTWPWRLVRLACVLNVLTRIA